MYAMSVSDSRRKAQTCTGPHCQRKTIARVDWRPALWQTLHTLAAASDPRLGKDDPFWVLYSTMPQLIPCSTCRNEWIPMSKRTPIHMYIGKPAVEVLRMTVDMHNEVNRRLGKPEFAFADAQKMYM